MSDEQFQNLLTDVTRELHRLAPNKTPLKKEDRELASFPRVVYEHELAGQNLAGLPVMADFIARTQGLIALDPEARIQVLLNNVRQQRRNL
jgi:hypothetical protein